jgi:hypothetical protein
MRLAVLVALAVGGLSSCAGSGARPLTPEEKARAAAETLHDDLRPERCNEALNAARDA